MAQNLAALFRPLVVGAVTLPNRAFWPAHSHNYDDDRAVAYYEERARGGYGLIITSRGTERLMEKIVPAVHRHGAKVLHQGWYPQPVNAGKGPRDRRDPRVSPSVLAPGARGTMAKEMTEEDIQASIAQAADWARRMRDAGCDGVELHLSHHHWPHTWLIGALNRRTDQYGGELANRMRFELATLEAVRKAVGKEFLVGLRRNGGYDTGGFKETREEAAEIARLLVATGWIDFLNISGYPFYQGMGAPRGAIVPEAAAIKQAIGGKLPVFAVGDRITDPRMANEFLADDRVDMIGMVRAGIADPEILSKAKEGRFDDIRSCVGAGQGCMGYWQEGPAICTQNPAVGYEDRWGTTRMVKAAATRKIVVVGAGPAGLEAALTLARRGHEVTVLEKAAQPGGQISLIRRSPRRNDFHNVVTWRLGQLEKLKVPVRLNVEATPALLAGMKPDEIVIATGGTPRHSLYPGSDLPHVFTPWDVMEGKVRGKKHVVVVDACNYYQASDPVEFLAARNTKVTVLTAAPIFCQDGSPIDWPTMWESLKGRNLDIRLNTRVTGIDAAGVHCAQQVNVGPATEHEYGAWGPPFTIEAPDAVVLAIGTDPLDGLYKALKGTKAALHRIGDCVAPRGVEHAIYEGHKLGWEIGATAS